MTWDIQVYTVGLRPKDEKNNYTFNMTTVYNIDTTKKKKKTEKIHSKCLFNCGHKATDADGPQMSLLGRWNNYLTGCNSNDVFKILNYTHREKSYSIASETLLSSIYEEKGRANFFFFQNK